MKLVLIQVVLIVVVVAVVARLFRSRGARSQAIRRLGLTLFAAFAVVSILFPSVWNRIAHTVGVGRGTDMVLYALVVAFLSFTVTTYLRFRELETRYTKLARRLALDEAHADPGPTGPSPSAPPSGGHPGDGLDEPGGRD
jgi:small membrane protein